jgi:CheY-like chemotaxis protein
MKDVKVLVVDDNPLVRTLIIKGLDPHCELAWANDGADALLKAIDDPPDLILSDYKMAAMDGRQLYEKLRSREQTRSIPFIFLASRAEIEEKLRPLVDGVEDFIAKPFFLNDLVRRTKKVVDRLQLEKLQRRSARPGVIQGRLEEMSIVDLLQSLEIGQKSCKLTVRRGNDQCEMFFAGGQCKDARLGALEGDEAVYRVVNWPGGEFEIDFNAAPDRTTITRSTTGLLMEALRLLDEANRDMADTGAGLPQA